MVLVSKIENSEPRLYRTAVLWTCQIDCGDTTISRQTITLSSIMVSIQPDGLERLQTKASIPNLLGNERRSIVTIKDQSETF